jgi:hypothetical protein
MGTEMTAFIEYDEHATTIQAVRCAGGVGTSGECEQ